MTLRLLLAESSETRGRNELGKKRNLLPRDVKAEAEQTALKLKKAMINDQ